MSIDNLKTLCKIIIFKCKIKMCIKIIWRKSVSCRIIKNNESQSSFILVKNKRKSSVSCIFLVFLKRAHYCTAWCELRSQTAPGHLDPFSRSSGATPPSNLSFTASSLIHLINKHPSCAFCPGWTLQTCFQTLTALEERPTAGTHASRNTLQQNKHPTLKCL